MPVHLPYPNLLGNLFWLLQFSGTMWLDSVKTRISRIIYVEKFQIFVKNLNNLWGFIEVYAVFVLNLCGEKNDKYEVWVKNAIKVIIQWQEVFLLESGKWEVHKSGLMEWPQPAQDWMDRKKRKKHQNWNWTPASNIWKMSEIEWHILARANLITTFSI